MIRQKPVKGGRQSLPSCVIKSIKDAVSRDAIRHDVSKSFVIAVILADHYRIKIERY